MPIRRRGVKRGPPLGPHPPPAPVKVSDGKSGTQRLRRRSQRRGSLFPKRASTGGALGRGAGVDASDLAAEREWAAPGCGRRGWGDGGRVEQGDEAEEGPSHEGAMRARGEAPVAVQGVQRLSAREEAPFVQGVRWGSICEHGRQRSAVQICEHGRSGQGVNLRARSSATRCKECGGSQICEHNRVSSDCKECGGAQSASTVVSALTARSAAGLQSASTVVSALRARTVQETVYTLSCGGSQICEHGRQRSQCKECGGGGICEHGLASTVVSALSARSAVGLNLRARSSAL